MNTWHEYVGNIHMHTVHSDGTGTYDDLAAAAQAVGLDFIVVTDHNRLTEGETGYRAGLLVLVGVEVHDGKALAKGNHLLCLDVVENPVAFAADPQALIAEVQRQRGLAFLAHPFERNTRLLPDMYPWRSWEVTGYQGVELWNYMAGLRQHVTSRGHGLLLSFMPALFTAGPLPEMLAKWDELTLERPVVAIGGSDAHAHTYRLGPLSRQIFPYVHCFRTVNTHILCDQPFSGRIADDAAAVYASLRQGRCWTGYDWIGHTRGFRFTAENGPATAIMGDTLGLHGAVRFAAFAPDPCQLRLLRNGQVVAQVNGRQLGYTTNQPGVYRIEAWRRAWFKLRGWIFSNPIYVRD